ncbi:hypothetical protein EYE40_02325 [Glaciihabitans arcticus]|uniref:Signal peptidase I n=1 Tax=Glaciihabitans arcticus TaxID=2668039 RepID=A0A4Q9GUR9_9MICO|nr:DUF5684 domain-containing protein [Glaciihabitans arcticus]TBN56323.1 hypothetical protein EYE40_02325 [Glaciihabitans arcticus]
MNDYDYDGYESDYSGPVGAMLGIFLVVYLVALAVSFAVAYVATGISLGALFRKTGVEQWKAWVPIYSTHEWLRLGGQNGNWAWFSLIGAGIVPSIFLFIGMHSTGKAFRKDTGFLILGILLPIVWICILGFGRDRYEPELIAQAGLCPPYIGHGAVPEAAYTQPQYPAPAQQQPAQPAPPTQPAAPTAPPAQD